MKQLVSVPREGWDSGPWDLEPDRLEWREGNIPALIVRGPLGALCGYVGISPGHPWYLKDYRDLDVDVHGGLTYGKLCQEGEPICHVPQEGEPAEVYWIGFDCGHIEDIIPGMDASIKKLGLPPLRMGGESYKTIDYIKEQVKHLAEQALRAL